MSVKKFAGLVLAVVVGCRGASGSDSEVDIAERQSRETIAPCEGCTLAVPYTSEAIPLLVVLHGDRETAIDATRRWAPAATAKQWAVLGLQCPRELGCDDQSRWYMWGADASWIEKQIDRVAAQHAIDPSRIYLAGWSGGASYIGQQAQQWTDRFAAVVVHGGGQPPARAACPSGRLPAYFLVGDGNPAHAAARDLHAWFERCKQPVEWDLLAGADHAREEAALDQRKAASILDWLASNARPAAVSTR